MLFWLPFGNWSRQMAIWIAYNLECALMSPLFQVDTYFKLKKIVLISSYQPLCCESKKWALGLTLGADLALPTQHVRCSLSKCVRNFKFIEHIQVEDLTTLSACSWPAPIENQGRIMQNPFHRMFQLEGDRLLCLLPNPLLKSSATTHLLRRLVCLMLIGFSALEYRKKMCQVNWPVNIIYNFVSGT